MHTKLALQAFPVSRHGFGLLWHTAPKAGTPQSLNFSCVNPEHGNQGRNMSTTLRAASSVSCSCAGVSAGIPEHHSCVAAHHHTCLRTDFSDTRNQHNEPEEESRKIITQAYDKISWEFKFCDCQQFKTYTTNTPGSLKVTIMR